MRSLGENLIILDFLDISFLFDVGIEVFKEEVFIVDRFNPDLVVVALVTIELRVQLLLDKLLLSRLRFRLHL